jgi:hypothetical protein
MKLTLKALFLGCISFLCCFSGFAQQNTDINENAAVLKNFVRRLNDKALSTDIILSQDLVTTKNMDEDMQEYLLASIDEIRINIQSKDSSKLAYVNFLEAGRRETGDIDLEGINPQQVFFVRYLKRLVFAAVVEGKKIASFTLVSKGNDKAHFVFY